MASHSGINATAVDDLHKQLIAAEPQVVAVYESCEAVRASLPDLVKKERLTPEESLNKAIGAGHEAMAQIDTLIGDSVAHAALLDRTERNVDLGRLAASATFLPRMSPEAHSEAHDMRTIAEQIAREAYSRRLQSFTPADFEDEFADVCASDPVSTNALAKIELLRQHLASRTDPETVPLKAGLSRVTATIADKWGERKAVLKRIEQSRNILDAANVYRGSAQTGMPSTRLPYVAFRSKQDRAA